MTGRRDRRAQRRRTTPRYRSPSSASVLLLAGLLGLLPSLAAASAHQQALRLAHGELPELLREQTESGVRAIEEGQHERAAEAFATAYALERNPALLFNLAQAYRKGGQDGPAAVFFERFLHEAPPGPLRTEAAQRRGEALSRLQRPGGGEPTPGAADRTGLLRDLVARGAAAAEAGRHDEAGRSFCAAYAAEPTPALLFNLAQMHRRAGRLRLALALFGRFLGESPPRRLRAEAEARMAELVQQIDRLFEDAEAAERAGERERALTGYQRYLQEAPRGRFRGDAEARFQLLIARSRPGGAVAAEAQRRKVRTQRARGAAAWALGALGIGALVTGAVLLGVDGQKTCPLDDAPGPCQPEVGGPAPGAVLLGTGAAALGTSAVLFFLRYRR